MILCSEILIRTHFIAFKIRTSFLRGKEIQKSCEEFMQPFSLVLYLISTLLWSSGFTLSILCGVN